MLSMRSAWPAQGVLSVAPSFPEGPSGSGMSSVTSLTSQFSTNCPASGGREDEFKSHFSSL